jgi:hypothetical protein
MAILSRAQAATLRAAVRTGRLRRTRGADGKPAFVANGEFTMHHGTRTVMQLARDGWLAADSFDYVPTPAALTHFGQQVAA